MKNIPVVIAELSGNHNGSKERAINLVHAAHQAGASMVKVQCFKPEFLTVKSDDAAYRVNHGAWAGKSLFELYESTYLPWEWYDDLISLSTDLGLEFFASVFDESSVDFLVSKECRTVKIASAEIIDTELIEYCSTRFHTIMISTGMASKQEIIDASSLAKAGGAKVVLFQCVSEYPAQVKDYNLGGLDFLKKYSDYIGISDHSMDNTAIIGSIAKGASFVEKHITLRRSDGGIDSHFSLEPNEFKQMVSVSSQIYEACIESDYCEKNVDGQSRKYRRSLYLKPPIKSGSIITEENIISLRPAYGAPVRDKHQFIGKKIDIDIEVCTPLTSDVFGKRT